MRLNSIIDQILGAKVDITVTGVSSGEKLNVLEAVQSRYDGSILAPPQLPFTFVCYVIKAKITVQTAGGREMSQMYTMSPEVYEQITAMVESGANMALTARIKGNKLPDNLPTQLYNAYRTLTLSHSA